MRGERGVIEGQGCEKGVRGCERSIRGGRGMRGV